MASPKEPAPDLPFEDPKSSAKKSPGYEKVVEELRHVLSELGQSEPTGSSSSDDPGFIHDQEPPVSVSPSSLPKNEESDRPFISADPVKSEAEVDPPSDADFWKGNVLGWPEAPDFSMSPGASPDLPDTAPMPAKERITEPVVEVPPESKGDPTWAPAEPQIPLPVEPPLTQLSGSDVPSKSPNPFEDINLPPAPEPPLLDPSHQELVIENLGTIELEPEPSPDVAADVPPRAPMAEVELPEQVTILPANLRVPIPTTLPSSSETAHVPAKDEVLKEMNITPTHVIQVACLYPDGCEHDANEFFAQLKAAALKSAIPRTLESVLTNPWFLNQIEVALWKKAASLAGAQYLFVLTHKKDKDLLRELNKVTHQDEIRSRVVTMEQTKLKTLYADLLADLTRTIDVKN